MKKDLLNALLCQSLSISNAFSQWTEPPVRFVRPRKMASRVEKVAGQTLILDCEVSRSNAEVTWKKNGEEVEDSRNITILEDGVMRQLTVHSLTLEDAGQYVCDAKDDVMDFHVKVQGRLLFLKVYLPNYMSPQSPKRYKYKKVYLYKVCTLCTVIYLVRTR